MRDRRLTRIVRECHDLPGKRLFEYVHPRLLEDFTENRLARSLARQIARRVPAPDSEAPISVQALRAIEPIVARYLDPKKRAHA